MAVTPGVHSNAGDAGLAGDPDADTPALTDLVPGEHRDHLDGLRAVAVYLVVAFHAGLGPAVGGFIGVDLFFVLSGYLVTGVLLRDLNRGGVRFGRFYARRARRLLPASAVMLAVTAVAYAAVASPVEVTDAADAFRASYLYVANWHFVSAGAEYFAQTDQSPVLHMWSLAVEEQFYVVWPVALAGLFALARRLGRGDGAGFGSQVARVRVLVGLGAAVSLAWALLLRTDSPNHAYYGTDARAYQLLAGSALALTPAVARRLGERPGAARVGAVAALAGLVVAASSALDVDPVVRGAVAAVLAVAVLAATEAEAGGPVGWLLRRREVVYLGQISYGTYLWHWPVVVLAVQLADPSPRALAVISAGLGTALAALSHEVLEHPIRASRRLDRHRLAVVAAGLAVSVVGGLVLVPAVTRSDTGGSGATQAVAAVGGTPVPDLDWDAIHAEGYGAPTFCFDGEPDQCTVVDGDGPHLLLMGDSSAEMMIDGFVAMARERGLRLSLAVASGCPWQRDLYQPAPEVRERCEDLKRDAYERVIPTLQPDVLLVLNSHEDRDDPGAPEGSVESTAEDARIREATESSIERLRAPGRRIVIVEPLPEAPFPLHPLQCLSEAAVVEDCRYLAVPSQPTWIELMARSIADAHDDVDAIDLDALVCPWFPICDPIVDGVVVKWDALHITRAWSRTLGDDLGAALEAIGVLGR